MVKSRETQRASQSSGLQIVGKVAKVLSERELIINIGSRDDVSVGDRFSVLSEAPLDVMDPDTGELLGSIQREKVRVKAFRVLENMTVCATYQSHWVGNFPSLAEVFATRIKVVDTFGAEDESLPDVLSLEQSIVRIGDPVTRVPRNYPDD